MTDELTQAIKTSSPRGLLELRTICLRFIEAQEVGFLIGDPQMSSEFAQVAADEFKVIAQAVALELASRMTVGGTNG